MKVVYPGQITIRYDIGRDLLIYDLFEFKPTTVHKFRNMHANGEDVCTDAEFTQVERLIRNTKRRQGVDNGNLKEDIDEIEEEKCCHLLNYG